MEGVNVPEYPESRIFKNVAKHVCEHVGDPSEVRLVINRKPNAINGSREPEIYDCSGLETGEYKTQKLER